MASKRDVAKLKQRYSILADWYGADFAMTEFSAGSHTPQPRGIGDLLPEVMKEVRSPEAGKLLQIESVWGEIIGPDFSRFAVPGYFRGDDFFVEVKHNALILELQPIIPVLKDRIDQKFGKGFCSSLHLVSGGSRKK